MTHSDTHPIASRSENPCPRWCIATVDHHELAAPGRPGFRRMAIHFGENLDSGEGGAKIALVCWQDQAVTVSLALTAGQAENLAAYLETRADLAGLPELLREAAEIARETVSLVDGAL